MKKAFRDIKRGVNKKVLKVPSIEQKVLDATSNDPWGPHGTYLADIAQASKNYHEYQIIMSVVWKRLGDSGKNWRHVYKGLTVLEYLIANGSERVIEDIREHAYQIEALSSFQYIDSTGRDQGSNIRMKSQSIVALVNDKDKIQEAREKAAANRDKLRNTSSGDYGNGYGDEKYGYKNDGRSESSERERGYEDHSSRGSNARVEDASPDVSRLESKLSGGAPPSYEDALTEVQSPTTNHQETTNSVAPAATAPPVTAKEDDAFDFFDPRGEPPGVAEVDLFGSLSDSFSSKALALVPPTNPNPSQAFVSVTQPFDDPFGDGPFRAIPTTDVQLQPLTTTPFGEPVATTTENDIEFVDILADILPPTQTLFHSQNGYAPQPSETTFSSSSAGPFDQPSLQNGYAHETTFSSSSAGPFDQPSLQNGYAHETTFSSSSAGPFDQPSAQNGYAHETTFSSSSAGPFDQPSAQNGYEAPFSSSSPSPFGGQSSAQNGYAPQPNKTTFSSSSTGPFGQPSPQNSYAHQPNETTFSSGPFDQPSPQNGYASQPNETTFSTISAGPPQTGYAPQPNDLFSQMEISAQTPISSSLPSPFGQPPSFPAQDGQSSGFPAHGGQTVSQPPFSAQGNQSVLQPAAQGGQSVLPSAQGGQPVSQPAFSAQGNQSSFPAAQGGQSILPPGFPAQGGQPSSQPSLPAAQGGQSIFPSGFPAQGGQPASQPSFTAAQGGQSILPFGFPAQGGQPASQPAAQGGQLGPQYGFPAQGSQPASQASFPAAQGGEGGQSILPPGFPAQGGQASFPAALGGQLGPQYGNRSGQPVSQPGFAGVQNASLGGFSSQLGTASQAGFPNSNGQANNFYGGFQPQSSSAPVPPLTQVNTTPGPQYTNSNFYQPPAVTSSTGALAIVPQQPTNAKFETKSTVWADTLNRGLVNLNISGSKTNPLSDIGIDFEAMNRKEKRLEKPSKTAVSSNVSMGKAMGSGSGMGRAGAGALRPAPNPMGMGMTPGYGGVNQPMGMNNMPQNMGSGMNIGQGFQQPPVNYNPMMGRGGGYGQQLPYGGYR